MNIANILKYCPEGTRLYSTTYGEVILKEVSKCSSDLDYPIKAVDIKRERTATFTKEGHFYKEYGECVLFPSKEQRDWRKFRLPIKRGDIMMHTDGSCPFIASGETVTSYPKAVCGISGVFTIGDNNIWTSEFYIPASIEVMRELFNKMKKAGYRWNSETLELEKIEKVKFKPFDKVLVRNVEHVEWRISLFSSYSNETYKYKCINGNYKYCIPYEGNKHLVGTNKDR